MTYAKHPLPRRLRLAAALILALALERWLTIEWTSPACNSEDRMVAAYGLPFPYTQWSLVSSMEYVWVPEIFALNIALLTAGLYPLLGLLPTFRRSRSVYIVFAAVAALGALMNLLVLWVTMAVSSPSLAHTEAGESMWDLRPVALHIDGSRRYDCTRSAWWFGPSLKPTFRTMVQEPVERYP